MNETTWVGHEWVSEPIWVGPEWVGSEIVGYRFRCMRKENCRDRMLARFWGLSATVESYEKAWDLGLKHAARENEAARHQKLLT